MNILRPAVFLWVIVTAAGALPQDARPELTPEQTADARRVLDVIGRIEAAGAAGPKGAPRSAEVTERELNAYIAYRIFSEGEEVLRDLRLKLFPKNRIEGLAVIDLRGRKLPAFIKPMMNVTFAGAVECEPGRARVRIESLYLEQQRIQAALLDMVFAAVAELEGTEPTKIEDWYALPYGIIGLETRQGRLVATY